jgi:hypothetical protein
VRILGGALLGVLCCRVIDLKIVTADSSVVHTELIIFNLLRVERSKIFDLVSAHLTMYLTLNFS